MRNKILPERDTCTSRQCSLSNEKRAHIDVGSGSRESVVNLSGHHTTLNPQTKKVECPFVRRYAYSPIDCFHYRFRSERRTRYTGEEKGKAMSTKGLDVVVFCTTVMGYVSYQWFQNKPCRRAHTTKQVSFRTNETPYHASILEQLPSLPSKAGPPILGLLFAASWCPDCTDVVPAVAKVVSSQQSQQKNNRNLLLDVVYIASDESVEQMLSFQPNNMKHVPFTNVEERQHLKKRYQTCAQREMTELGLSTRRHGLPTLLLVNAQTGEVLLEDAVEDVLTLDPETALTKWQALL